VLFVDYGHTRSVYYHPQRRQGTLMCHRHHQTCDDPLLLPGLQDITVWVDWTAVHRALAALGGMLQGAATQAQFLVACLQHLQQGDPQRLQFWLQEAGSSAVLQTLLRPEAMGEGFKVALWSKAVELAAPLLPNRLDLR
jgi:SAM-dependent MidA family methyltransferase